jgi:hypothetical protein
MVIVSLIVGLKLDWLLLSFVLLGVDLELDWLLIDVKLMLCFIFKMLFFGINFVFCFFIMSIKLLSLFFSSYYALIRMVLGILISFFGFSYRGSFQILSFSQLLSLLLYSFVSFLSFLFSI